jgi:hypothetical protein
MHAATGEGIEVNRQGADERFAFAGGHFGDLPGCAGNAADELDVKGTISHLRGWFAHGDVLAAQAAAGIFDHGEGLGQDFVQPGASSPLSVIWESSAFQAAVLARNSSADSFCKPASISLMRRTTGQNFLTSRSFRDPNIFLSNPIMTICENRGETLR